MSQFYPIHSGSPLVFTVFEKRTKVSHLNLQDLVDIYRQSPVARGISRAVQESESPKIAISGLKGSVRALLGAAFFNNSSRSQLYILPDREAAEYFQNDLQTFLERKQVWLYPSPFRNDIDIDSLDNNAVLERTDLLNRLRDHQRTQFIIVTYPEALPEKVINQEALKANLFEVAVGDNLDLDFIIEFLVQYNFERADFVYEPGSFSIRGGIVDIFSYANELPFRIELLGDEVESIRVFDPETQLSVRKMQRVTILPNMEGQEKNYGRVSFLNFLPKDTVIFASDLTYTEEIVGNVIEKIANGIPVAEDQPALKVEDFEKFTDFKKGLSRFAVVEWAGRYIFEPTLEIEMEVQPQPEFNKKFELLAENLRANYNKGITNIIFSDQSKQIERLYAIFEDLKIPVDFVPVYKVLHEGFVDVQSRIACYTEHQIFGRYQKYKGRKTYSRNEAITLKELYDLKPGDFVTHIDHGVGVFSGLEKIDINGKKQEAVRLKYKGGDLLYVNIHSLHKITRYVGQEGKAPKLNKLGTNTWETLKNKTKSKVKDIARDLIKLYAQRRAQKGFAFSKDNYMQTELEASFIYEDTPDQARSTEDVKRDMEASYPMDRLVCGDVGFGKTEVAIRAAFKAVLDGKQAAVLVPTTILASQHYKTFKNRLAEFPVTVDFISRFKNPAQQKDTLKRLEAGKVDILIGTHRVLSKDIKWKDLGLLVIDEEQKFGVAAKEKLRAMKTNVDTLTLTATPIPRTLQFSLMGARDMSIINTPPPNRQPVKTRIEVFSKEVIRDAIEFEVNRGGQVYFVHNRVKDIQDMGETIRNLVPYAKVAVAHAQMEPEKLEEIMLNFIEGYYDVLVSTNIVESGLDIPNANTMIIDQAQNFGLSDLYQLRGRVGRSNRKAYCYLLTPPMSVVTSEARKRLAALEEHTELGSGFHIAMKDLDIRGAGNILGAEQSGFIAEIGYEMYQKILREAMTELREEEFGELFADQPEDQLGWETQIETDLELLIPDRYVTNVNERLVLYNKINDLDTEEQLQAFETELIDRFGPIPGPTKELLNIVRLKWQLQKLNIEKASLKRGKFKGYFLKRAKPQFFQGETFGKIIELVQNQHHRTKLEQKEDELIWTINGIHSVKEILVEVMRLTNE
jgi:transcription-repair coupling factor (superfamily II helicase)